MTLKSTRVTESFLNIIVRQSLPARIKSPKDKPSVESTVGTISTWIIAAIRNEKFFLIGTS